MDTEELMKRLEELQQEKHTLGTVEHFYNKMEQMSTAIVLSQFRLEEIALTQRVNLTLIYEKLYILGKIYNQESDSQQGSQGGGAAQGAMGVELQPETNKPFQMKSKEQTTNTILAMRHQAQNQQSAQHQPSQSSGQQLKK